MTSSKMPVKAKPFKHQREAYVFVLTLFDCLKGVADDVEYESRFRQQSAKANS